MFSIWLLDCMLYILLPLLADEIGTYLYTAKNEVVKTVPAIIIE